MDLLYDKYEHVILSMGPKYKNWIMVDAEYDKVNFEKEMKINKYVLHLLYSPIDGKFIYVVLFHHASPHLEKADMFKRFLDILIIKVHKVDADKKKKFLEKHLNDNNEKNKSKITKIMNADKSSIETILITKHDLTTYCVRSVKTKNEKINLVVHNYLHKHFLIEISKGPLCGLHRVISKQEANILCSQQIMTCRSKLPFILITDAQLIWCNARIGDIIKINVNSELTAEALRYRVVVPINGKIQNQQFEDELDEEEIEYDAEIEVEPEPEPDAEPDVNADVNAESDADADDIKELDGQISEDESEEEEFDKY